MKARACMEREPVSLAILDIMLPEMDGFTSAAKYGRSICFDGAYLQAAQAELWEAARGRIEVAETDCTEVGFAEKSKPAAGEKVRERQILICRTQ